MWIVEFEVLQDELAKHLDHEIVDACSERKKVD